ncbi:MAG: glycosyltransferase [Actinobacteria bacterium]|uniref:Unannotated protein n=1 Tax=freshwater metagenome TaxID=449393 RepID=A0A6J7JJ13_9ZZZZ|nr:glycosyltransferase [Actinomycetota bacterium]
MRIGVAAIGDPALRSTWSGIPAAIMAAATSLGHEPVAVGPLNAAGFRCAGRAARGARVFGQHVQFDRIGVLRRAAAREVRRGVEHDSLSAVISVTSLALSDRVSVGAPLALWTDAIVPLMVDYYPQFTGLPNWNVQGMMRAEREALASVDLIALASQWALDGLRTHYPEVSTPALVVPFGPSLSPEPGYQRTESESESPMVLSVGVDWHRKGMDTLVEAAGIARDALPDLRVEIVGCTPPPGSALPPWVRIHGRLDPSSPTQREQLEHLFRSASAFALLSRAECAGLVLAEAASYGLLSVGTRTGGIPSMVNDGVTGLLVEVGDARAAADAVVRVCSSSGLAAPDPSAVPTFAAGLTTILGALSYQSASGQPRTG